MPSNRLVLCPPLLLLPSVFPNIRVLFNKSALHIIWPKYWSFSFSISPSSECSWLISFRTDWYLISLLSKGFSRVFSSTTVWKDQFFSAQPSLWSKSHICTGWFPSLHNGLCNLHNLSLHSVWELLCLKGEWFHCGWGENLRAATASLGPPTPASLLTSLSSPPALSASSPCRCHLFRGLAVGNSRFVQWLFILPQLGQRSWAQSVYSLVDFR